MKRIISLHIFLSFILLIVISLMSIGSGAHFALAQNNSGPERITNLESTITISTDGSLGVKEVIDVVATGDTIKHGIYRDFPTSYKDKLGNKYKVRFDVVKVTRDGQPEDFHIENKSNGKRVYIGSEHTIIAAGAHVYTLEYVTNRQIGFFQDDDELYWNITGNGWDYKIEKTSAYVYVSTTIPAQSIRTRAYTGSYESKEQAYATSSIQNGIVFTATRVLEPREGLTIVVSMPKGFIHEPTQSEKIGYFFKDNKGSLVALILFVLVLVYYIRSWQKYGKDPKPSTIIPHYEQPKDMSPAAVRYLTKMYYDKKVLSAAVLSMAVKGYLKIEENEKEYTITQTGASDVKLSEEERAAAQVLFASGQSIELKQENHATVSKAEKELQTILKTRYGSFIVMNIRYIIFGLIFSIITLFIGFSIIESPLFIAAYVVLIVIANAIFLPLLPRRTLQGRAVQDEIEGFKWFLSVTEKDRMNFHNPPEKTPELFERFLPYALALGVENKWSEQFADVFARINAATHGGYHPAWYIGTHYNALALSSFTSSFSKTFSTAISSSTMAPGSSSGMSGGFSGGGGGGGGGGGW